MTDKADTTDTLHQYWGLPERMPLDELLIAAELDDVQFGIDYVVVVVDFDGDFPMSLDPGDGIDDEFGSHVRFSSDQSNWLSDTGRSTGRPLIRSSITVRMASADGGHPGMK